MKVRRYLEKISGVETGAIFSWLDQHFSEKSETPMIQGRFYAAE
jgi:hypothetical protein